MIPNVSTQVYSSKGFTKNTKGKENLTILQMLINIPDPIIMEMLDCNYISSYPHPPSIDHRSPHVARLQYHFSEYLLALVAKELQNKRLTHEKDV